MKASWPYLSRWLVQVPYLRASNLSASVSLDTTKLLSSGTEMRVTPLSTYLTTLEKSKHLGKNHLYSGLSRSQDKGHFILLLLKFS